MKSFAAILLAAAALTLMLMYGITLVSSLTLGWRAIPAGVVLTGLMAMALMVLLQVRNGGKNRTGRRE